LISLLNLRQFHIFIQLSFEDSAEFKAIAKRLFDLIAKQVFHRCVPSSFQSNPSSSLNVIVRPKNADDLFIAFAELMCDLETFTSIPKKTLNYILSCWPSPKSFENVIERRGKTKVIMDLLDLCIPSAKLYAPSPDQKTFEEFLAIDENDENLIFYSVPTTSMDLNFAEYVKYFDWSIVKEEGTSFHRFAYKRKFIPFRLLKKKLFSIQ